MGLLLFRTTCVIFVVVVVIEILVIGFQVTTAHSSDLVFAGPRLLI